MAEDGIVGAYNGSQAREVLVTMEQWMEMSGQQGAAATAPATAATEPPKRPRNRILPAPAVDDSGREEDEELSDAEDEEEAEDELDEEEFIDDEEQDEECEEEECEDEEAEDDDEYDRRSYEAESA